MKTVKVTETTHERLTKIGDKGQSYEDIIVDLLEERKHLPKLKEAYEKAFEKNEQSKKTGLHSIAVEAANTAIYCIKEFVKAVEGR